MGDPAQDVGNFLAHLKLLGLQTATDCESQAGAFLDGYRDVRRLPAQTRVHAHFNSTLLRIACIYAFSSKWRHLTPRLLDHRHTGMIDASQLTSKTIIDTRGLWRN